MTNSQRMAAELAAIKIRLNAQGADKLDDEAHAALFLEHNALEIKRAEAEAEEQRQADAAFGPGHESQDTEELRALVGRANLEFADGFDNILNRRATDGAFAELQSHRGLPSHLLPLDTLREERASVTGLTDAPSQTELIRDLVFAAPIAEHMGWRIQTVPYGTPNFPVIGTGVAMSVVAAGSDVAQTTGTIAASALEPGRLTGQLQYKSTDAMRYRSLPSALRQHVARAWGSAADQLVLTDTANGLPQIAEPADPGATTTFAQYLAAFAGRVDGQYAPDIQQVRAIVGNETYGHLAGVVSGDVTALQALVSLMGRNLRVAARMVNPSSNDQQGYSVGMTGAPHGIVATWDGLEVVSDPYTNAAGGEVLVTVIGGAAIRMLRVGAYTRHRFQVA